MQVRITDFLQTGEKNAQSAKELCSLLHLDHRELTAAIERERRQGSPICASSSTGAAGYYLAKDKQEMQNYCKSLHHRAGEIHKTRKACLNTLDKLPDREEAASNEQ